MAGSIIELTDAQFDEVVMESDLPVLVDFWAPWCGPCRAMTPVLEELAGEWDGKVKVCKINVEEHKEKAGSFEVQAIPTMILFKGGAVVKRLTGSRPKAALAEELKDALQE